MKQAKLDINVRDQVLIAGGADVEAKNNKCLTPLHVAASFGRKEDAELLIGNGANADERDNDSKTPILLAEDRSYKEIAIFLYKHSAEERSF